MLPLDRNNPKRVSQHHTSIESFEEDTVMSCTNCIDSINAKTTVGPADFHSTPLGWGRYRRGSQIDIMVRNRVERSHKGPFAVTGYLTVRECQAI